ncbi:MAG: Acyltransferase 3, partial [Rhodoferax sp.]|nr:Acyltransferase 3 [Rhodoferax sp.]
REKKTFDWWLKLYASRLFRLAPLYIFMLLTLVFLVAMESNWNLKVPLSQATRSILTWLAFTIGGQPDINKLPGTSIIVARVPWSLVYELIFYSSLPIIAFTLKIPKILNYSLLTLALTYFIYTKKYFYLSFCGGISAALMFDAPALKYFAKTPVASCSIIALIALLIFKFPDAYKPIPILLIGLIFLLITAGNSLFGILTSRLSRIFGEMAYSIYLIHGLLLFIAFGVMDIPSAHQDVLTHWQVVWCISPFLIGVSYLTHAWIEKPPMDWYRTIFKHAANKGDSPLVPLGAAKGAN